MKKLFLTLCAGAMAMTAVAATAPGVGAAPLQLRPAAPSTDVENVQYRHQARRGFYRHGGHGYYNGHRGWRDRRAGYRYHNGFWFPPAAFIAGAIIGGAIASPPVVRQAVRPAGNAHVRWCYDRYRSYRASDNSFQPYSGPRQQCYSPYG